MRMPPLRPVEGGAVNDREKSLVVFAFVAGFWFSAILFLSGVLQP